MAGREQPIIIKRKKIVVAGGHHGGAWKVAYADFVTAMMAFFLLMWLLNATTEDQRKGLADYFNPSVPISRISGGGSAALDGSSVFADNDMIRDGIGAASKNVAPSLREDGVEKDRAEETAEEKQSREALEALESQINQKRKALEGNELADHIQTRMTQDGLLVELIDDNDTPLFELGSARPSALLGQLLEVVAPVLATAQNQMEVLGHTDALAYQGEGTYSNWELSTDRANIARRLLVVHGLPSEQISAVVGRASTEPLSSDPFAPQNRRIAVLLRSEKEEPGTDH